MQQHGAVRGLGFSSSVRRLGAWSNQPRPAQPSDGIGSIFFYFLSFLSDDWQGGPSTPLGEWTTQGSDNAAGSGEGWAVGNSATPMSARCLVRGVAVQAELARR